MKRSFSRLVPLLIVPGLTTLFSCLFVLLLGVVSPAVSATAWAATLSPAPSHAKAYLISPADGQTITSPFKAQFGLAGMGIAPAGVERDNTGHHHLLIDMAELPELTEPLQASDQLKHFGAGQTEAELSLSPGEHTLQLILGDDSHVPHEHPVISEKITINVRS